MSRTPWFLTFVGTGSMSSPFRNLPATLLRMSATTLLIDCGDGTMARLRQNRIGVDLDAVLLTSLGSGEVSGLLALGEIASRSGRKPLRLVGPPGTKRVATLIDSLSDDPAKGLFDAIEAEPGQMVLTATGGPYVEAIPMERSAEGGCLAYLLYEDPTPGRVNAERAKALGISGDDFSKLQRGETVRRVRPSDVIGPSEPGKRLVVAGRGRPTPSLLAELQGANAAVFSAPFMDERLELAQEASYLTGWEAAELSTRAGVETVVLSQTGPYAPLRDFVAEARQFHRHVFCATDGDELEVSAERGRTRFHRGGRGFKGRG